MDMRYSENYFHASILTFNANFLKESSIRIRNEFLVFPVHTITNVSREVDNKCRAILSFTPVKDRLFSIDRFLHFPISRISANAMAPFPQKPCLIVYDHNTTKYSCALCNVGNHLLSDRLVIENYLSKQGATIPLFPMAFLYKGFLIPFTGLAPATFSQPVS